MQYITHPLIKKDLVQARDYQLSIGTHALDGNTLVVLPTGLGKTVVALITAASRLFNYGGKVLLLAPTRPLVEQHLQFFRSTLAVDNPEGENKGSEMFTGDDDPEIRAKTWENTAFIVATPQVTKNDIISGRYDLSSVSLLVIDECHRAIGNYAYVFIAERYMATASNPLILGMTASPGGKSEKIDEICRNLSIKIVETRSVSDSDVAPYVHDKEVEIVNVELPVELKQALLLLSSILESRLSNLHLMGFEVPKREQLTMKSLNNLNAEIQRKITLKDSGGYTAASIYAEIMKVRHATTLAESQGSEVLKNYLAKLISESNSPNATKASKNLVRDPDFNQLLEQSEGWKEECHPKLEVLLTIISHELSKKPDSRIIVFATYRDSVQKIVEKLNSAGIHSERFVGQTKKEGEKGLTQKEQISALTRFREGSFQVLVATSVGEEGLDIPSTDLVIFYEAVPSEIRSIQRKGRTGRHCTGKVILLVTKGTTDETFRFVSQNREKVMVNKVENLQYRKTDDNAGVFASEKKQSTIDAFSDIIPILVDDRETSSAVVSELSTLGARLTITRLPYGDYSIGEKILIERKTSRDFVDSLIDRDLIGQIRTMAGEVWKPLLIIEGNSLYSQRNIHENAIRGALAAITIDLGVPVLFTADETDTAKLLITLARRESNAHPGNGKSTVHRNTHHTPVSKKQEEIIMAFPGIGAKTAKELLVHFGSVKALVNATEAEILKIEGMGEKRAARICELASHPYVQ